MTPNTEARTITVEGIARVEGGGSLSVSYVEGTLTNVQLRIFEPPRLFEAILRGRHLTEAPDITARICGICPVAYQVAAAHAMERLCGMTIPEALRSLRRLFMCGEWIASHTIHIYLLHAPDFLGFSGGVDMARVFPREVERGLELKRIGNDIIETLGGRAVHPINLRVGGWYRIPTRAELLRLRERIARGATLAYETVEWVRKFSFPQHAIDAPLVALRGNGAYPLTEGMLTSSTGLPIPLDSFAEVVQEEQRSYSTALFAHLTGVPEPYQVGPVARFALNWDLLPSELQAAAKEAGVSKRCRNPFQSIVIRALEVWYACQEALRIIEAYEQPPEGAIPTPPRAGTGYGIVEAPRGILFHRYTVDDAGLITDAKIIPPTSQNQSKMEADLREVLKDGASLGNDALQQLAERTIRNFDPCISCATHFLALEVDRT